MEKLFNSFSEALSTCSNSGYQNPDLVRVVVEKNRLYRDKIRISSSAPTLDLGAIRTIMAAALSLSSKKLCVIDFGGGEGIITKFQELLCQPRFSSIGGW